MTRSLEVHDLHKTFQTATGESIRALQGVSFSLDQGQILAVIGHNGSGKSTLLNCIRRSLAYERGTIRLAGKLLDGENANIVSVYQEAGAGIVSSMTALENVTLTMSRSRGYMTSLPSQKYRKKIEQELQDIGLLERFSVYRDTRALHLSGGQRQQLAVIMAVLRKPDILLLDEFVANLDPAVKMDILLWLKNWIKNANITAILVTHDLQVAAEWGDLLIELSDGRIVRQSSGE